MTERREPYRARPRLPKQGSVPELPTCTIFALSLPPTSNHQYDPILRRVKGGRLAHGKRWSDAYKTWRDEAVTVVRGWEPCPKTPLAVRIDLYVPRSVGRHSDIGGYVKGLIDATVGARNDQYVDWLLVQRCEYDGPEGRADVWIGYDVTSVYGAATSSAGER